MRKTLLSAFLIASTVSTLLASAFSSDREEMSFFFDEDILPIIEIVLRLNGIAVIEERGLYIILSIR